MGRFPHPDDAERYEQLHPGFLDRHFRLYEAEQKIVEAQSAHRRSQEQLRLEADIRHEGRGLTFAFILANVLVVAAVLLGVTGHDAVAGACIATGLVSGVGAFIVGRQGTAKERISKLRMLSSARQEDGTDSGQWEN